MLFFYRPLLTDIARAAGFYRLILRQALREESFWQGGLGVTALPNVSIWLEDTI
jgi:hypothetical protein